MFTIEHFRGDLWRVRHTFLASPNAADFFVSLTGLDGEWPTTIAEGIERGCIFEHNVEGITDRVRVRWVPIGGERCEWFALCGQPAIGRRPHAILGDVPICEQCNERHLRPVDDATFRRAVR